MDRKLSDQNKAFYSDGYKIGIWASENGYSKKSILKATEQIYLNIDELIESLLNFASQQNTKVHCEKKCDWCCHQPVYALTNEIIFLKEYIKTNFPENEQEEFKKRAIEKDEHLSKLNNDDLQNSKHPCPFLKDGNCKVYKARPMACRIYLSLNLKSCKTFFKDRSSFPQLMEFPLQAGRMMNEGYKAALKLSGLISQEFRIEEGFLSESVIKKI